MKEKVILAVNFIILMLGLPYVLFGPNIPNIFLILSIISLPLWLIVGIYTYVKYPEYKRWLILFLILNTIIFIWTLSIMMKDSTQELSKTEAQRTLQTSQ